MFNDGSVAWLQIESNNIQEYTILLKYKKLRY